MDRRVEESDLPPSIPDEAPNFAKRVSPANEALDLADDQHGCKRRR